MLVPDEIRKCVVFLSYRSQRGYELAGTAFFVGVPLEDVQGAWLHYLVTAKHVIDHIRLKSIDQRVYIRINTHQEGAKLVESPIEDWRAAPQDNEAIDIALFAWVPQSDVFDFRVIPLANFASAEVVDTWGFGVGDEVFFPGLFVNHHGRERNVPIVRGGTIAAMPDELVQTELGAMRAYLVEARSIGGLSGSPVFVHAGGIREDPETGKFRMLAEAQFRLLGVMHGHWGVQNVSSDVPIADEVVNMGIGIVVPIGAVADLLDDPEVVMQREEVRQRAIKDRLPMADAAESSAERVTREEFMRDLTKVTRPVEEPDPEKS